MQKTTKCDANNSCLFYTGIPQLKKMENREPSYLFNQTNYLNFQTSNIPRHFNLYMGNVMQRSQPKITISYNNFLNDSSYRKAGGITTNNNIKMRSFIFLLLAVAV